MSENAQDSSCSPDVTATGDDGGDKKSSPNVIVAVDNSDQSEFAFDWFVDNSAMSSHHLIVTHCPDVDSTMRTPMLLSGPEFYAEALREENVRIRHIEQKFTEKLNNKNLDGEFVVMGGKAGDAILHAARTYNASMVVIGSSSMGRVNFVKRTLLGGVSDYVLNHSVLPVLVCRYRRPADDVIKKQNTEEQPAKKSLRERLLRRYHSVDIPSRLGRGDKDGKKKGDKKKEDKENKTDETVIEETKTEENDDGPKDESDVGKISDDSTKKASSGDIVNKDDTKVATGTPS